MAARILLRANRRAIQKGYGAEKTQQSFCSEQFSKAPSGFSSSGAGRTGYIATAQLSPMQQNFSHRGKTFSANAIAQSEAIAQSVLICSERSIHPANPAKGRDVSLLFGFEELTRPALSGLNIVSSLLRLTQVLDSDIPYRAINFILGLFVFIHRFILTRHFALQVFLRPSGTLSQILHLRIVTKGSTFTVMLKSIL